jgi:hypothetical protein
VFDQRTLDILRSDAQLKREAVVVEFQQAFYGGRYANNDGNSEYQPEQGGTGEEVESQLATPDEQQRELPAAGVGNSNATPV